MKIITSIIICIFFLSVAKANDFSNVQDRIQSQAHSMARACVGIKTDNGQMGSGVVVNDSGLIFSAAHVYKHLNERVSVFFDGGHSITATVIRLNNENDIAVLQSDKGALMKTARLNLAGSIQAGKAMVAAGHPSGYSSERPSPLRIGFGFMAPSDGMIYSTCRISVGDSGGPLYNDAGLVCAIHSAMDGSGKYASHVPVQRFFELWPELNQSVFGQNG